MLIVALALLPVMGLLLLCMDRIEDHLSSTTRPRAGRHRARHLRLVTGHTRRDDGLPARAHRDRAA
ncbi:hypothetical protein [Streptomyces sp. NPDC046939]|uniref:hypothetical protein n=1 Tax=Streptomyces sp. NPDC046939 TaxID=3155376 RepID=UPI0033FDC4D4